MKGGLLFLIGLIIGIRPANAQICQPLAFEGQPVLQSGIDLSPHALFYENLSGDTSQSAADAARESFVSGSALSDAGFLNNRQMNRTRQVIWVRFCLANTSDRDTIRLWYSGGVHAYLTMFESAGNGFSQVGAAGLCTIVRPPRFDFFAIPLRVPPHTTKQFLVRVTDYLLVFDKPGGTIHTALTYRSAVLGENRKTRWLFFWMVIFLGCLGMMSLYTFYHYLLGRDKAFLYYSIYAGLACLWMLEFANPRFELGLTPAAIPWLGHPMSFSFNHVLALVYAAFVCRLLSVSREQPFLFKVIKSGIFLLAILQLFVIVQVFTGILIDNYVVYYLLDAGPALLVGVLVIIATLRSKSRLKAYLLTGEISLYLISLSPFHGLFLIDDPSQGYAELINYPPLFMGLGLLVELFCFLLALAYRGKLIEEERNNVNQRLATMELTALRAQMNPHFIFNCLNSIKLYTTDSEPEKAGEYLTKFSRLIRLVLENSQSEQVSLQNELEALGLYLEMERMRFKNKLQFEFQISESVETALIDIPPMLLQPYVENAVWHGIMHKEEGGWVHIGVEQPAPDRLLISITDNGVGRAQAAFLKSKSASRHKAFGMKAGDERIVLINQIYKKQASVQIRDLRSSDGIPAGTEVLLELSI